MGHQPARYAISLVRNRYERRARLAGLPFARIVRDSFVTERKVTFTREQIAFYAEASGDMNPIHLDDEFARSVGLPSLIAHGMLQMGIAATVAGEAAGGPHRLRRLAVRFAGMVVPGDTVTFSAEQVGEGKLEVKAFNQHGEAVLTKSVAEYGTHG
ncbi:MAG: dehydratase [Chloroflexi bacterium]|nr:MAG: dehydratase [Chloroflexota bacterium]